MLRQTYQMSPYSPRAIARLNRKQAELDGSPIFDVNCNGSLLDTVSLRSGTFTRAGTLAHPVYGNTLAANAPAYVPVGLGGSWKYNVTGVRSIFAVSGSTLYGIDDTNSTTTKVLQKSTDDGVTWSTVATFLKRVRSVHVTAAGTILVAIGDDGTESDATACAGEIHRSTDGTTFTKVYDIPAGNIVGWGWASSGLVVLAAEYGGRTVPKNARHLLRSADDGATWAVAKDFGDTWGGHLHSVAFDPYNAGHVYLTTGDIDACCEVWKSTDSGENWVQKLATNQENRFVGIQFDADYVYLGGDGYHDTGDGVMGFGFYKFDRSTEAKTLMTVMHSPCYYMWKDPAGQIFAFTINDNVDTTDNYACIYALRNGAWELQKRYLANSAYAAAGLANPVYAYPTLHVNANALLLTHDYTANLAYDILSTRTHAVRVQTAAVAGTAEKILWALDKDLPTVFTLLLLVRFPTAPVDIGDLNYILCMGQTAADQYNIGINSSGHISFAKKKTGETTKAFTIINGADMAANDLIAICARQKSNYSINGFGRLNSGKYRRAADTAATFAIGGVRRIQTGYTSAGYEPNCDICRIAIYPSYLSDGEAEEIIEGWIAAM